jgi:phosphatidylserine/phosphatidylglycerophosphate/cardiolipin synthase-like enzyme
MDVMGKAGRSARGAFAPRRCLAPLVAVVAAMFAFPLAGQATADDEPGGSTPSHLTSIAKTLRDRSPGTEGKVWWMTDGNQFPSDWLLQTPDCWGKSDCGQPPPGQKRILEKMKDMIASAKHGVDLTELGELGPLLSGYPEQQYFDAIVDGLVEGHKRHPSEVPVVRILIGVFPPTFPDNDLILARLQKRVGGWAKFQVGYMKTTFTSWNHAKVLDVDGRAAIVGGMNYWADDYVNTKHPVNDLSIQVEGPAAWSVKDFTNVLWKWTCDHPFSPGVWAVETPNLGCIAYIPHDDSPEHHAANVPMMVVGKLGEGIDVPGEAGRQSSPIEAPALNGNPCPQVHSSHQTNDVNNDRAYEYRNPGETALRALVASAKRSVFISQQDMLSCLPNKTALPTTEAKFDERLLHALAEKIHADLPVRIIVSDPEGGGYGNDWELHDIGDVLREQLQHQYNLNYEVARGYVCNNVGLAFISNNGSTRWGDGKAFHNHAKLVSVDDEAFYVGSGNIYPSRLQELGLIVENHAASERLKAEYMNPLWENARKHAFIDPDDRKCGHF